MSVDIFLTHLKKENMFMACAITSFPEIDVRLHNTIQACAAMNLKLDLCPLMKDARLLEVTSYCVYIASLRTREALWPSAKDSGSNGFEPWPGTLYCVLGLDTLTVPLLI